MPLDSSTWNAFKLRQGTNEPGTFRIGDGGGAAVLTGVISGTDLDTILREGVETAYANNDTGQITRTLPVAHPLYPWLFLKNVDNAQGISFIEKVEADPEGTLEAPALPYFSDYTEYQVQVTFEPRPYALLRDESMEEYTINYYDADGIARTKTAWKEWFRYVEWIRNPAAEWLEADIGQNTWSNPGGDGGTTGPQDNTGAGTGQLRVLQPASTYKLIWHRVPYGYVMSDNTYFDIYQGHINQASWAGFPAGSLLLQAVNTVRIYTTPFPDFNTYEGYDIVSQDKLCDLEFVFLYVNRTAARSVSPTNPSHIIDGHNSILYPRNGKYYYLENFKNTAGTAGTGRPVYPSVPFDLLFQNPDGPA